MCCKKDAGKKLRKTTGAYTEIRIGPELYKFNGLPAY
jgi:hypothetical protein